MSRHTFVLLGGTLLLCGLTGRPCLGETDAAWRPDYESIARNVVTQSVRVKAGDIVLINGHPRDLELLEDLAVNVSKLGAFPLVSIDTERMTRRSLEETPDRFDKQDRRLRKMIANNVDVMIDVDAGIDPAIGIGLSPERIAGTAEAFAFYYPTLMKRNVRYAWLGNDLYPSEARAKEWGVTQADLARVFWEGCNADPARLQANSRAVAAKLSAGKVLRITHPNGTDLTMRIEGRQIVQSDGVLSPEELAKGGAAVPQALPAGEVYFAPVPGTASGKIIIPRYMRNGQEIPNLTLSFSEGNVTEISAPTETESFRSLKKEYDLAGAGKEKFATVDLGVNPDLKIIPGSRMQTFVPAGMVTVNIGNSLGAGGDNGVMYWLGGYIPGATVTVDDAVLIDKGELKVSPQEVSP